LRSLASGRRLYLPSNGLVGGAVASRTRYTRDAALIYAAESLPFILCKDQGRLVPVTGADVGDGDGTAGNASMLFHLPQMFLIRLSATAV
jgi:hypothetical protein